MTMPMQGILLYSLALQQIYKIFFHLIRLKTIQRKSSSLKVEHIFFNNPHYRKTRRHLTNAHT